MLSQAPKILLIASRQLGDDLSEIIERQGLDVLVRSAAEATSRTNRVTCDVLVVEDDQVPASADLSGIRSFLGDPPLLSLTREPPAVVEPGHAAWGPWSDESLMATIFRLLFLSWRKREYRILDQMPIPIYIWRTHGADFRLIGYNEAALAITERNAGKVLGRLASEIYTDRPDLIAPFDACRRTGKVVVKEVLYDFRTVEKTRPLLFHYASVPPNDVLIFTEDLMEIRKTQEQLVRRESIYETIFKVAGEGIALNAPSGILEAVNPKGCQIFGRTEEELIGSHPTDLVEVSDGRDAEDAKMQQLTPGETVDSRRVIRTPDGSESILAVNAARRPDGGFVAFFRDITAAEAERAEKHRIDAELRVSKARLEEAERIAGVGNWYWDFSTGEGQWSGQVYRIFGVDQAEYEPTYEAFVSRVHPEDRASIERTIRECLETRSSYSSEHRILWPDGTVRFLEERAEVVESAGGELLGMRGTVLDITERRRVEEELRQSKERLEEAERIAGVGNWYWDVASGVVLWSDQVYRIFGVERDSFETSYESFLSRVHSDDRPRVREAIGDALTTRSDYHVEHRIVLPDGSVRHVEERGEVLGRADGEPAGMRGTVLDITARKRIEQRREKVQRLYSTLSSVTEATVHAASEEDMLRNTCRITVQESGLGAACVVLPGQHDAGLDGEPILALADWLGADEEAGQCWLMELQSANLDRTLEEADDRVCNDAESQQALGHCVAESVLALGGRSMAVFRLHRGGETAGIFCVASPRRHFFGDEEVGLLRRLVDHLNLALETRHGERQRREAEARQLELQDSLRRSETMAAMGRLVSGVAHEVRNPLFGLSAALDAFAAEFGERSDVEAYLQVFRSQISRLSVLMTDLLDLGRPGELKLADCKVADLLDGALEQCASILAPFELIVEDRVATDVSVRADRDRFQQVMVNLLENAAQHSQEGAEIIVRFEERDDLDGRGGLALEVLDCGPGFRDEDLDQVLEPFFSRRRGGNGLGLSIVDRIVQDHGGSFEVANRRPEGVPAGRASGAAVRIWLPGLP